MPEAPERVAYFNGRILPENQVLIPFRDAGFIYGYAVFDTLRTFRHELYKLDEHVARLFRSIAYLGLEPDLGPDDFVEITKDVVARNVPLLDSDDEYWVTQRVTLGQQQAGSWKNTVIIECKPLPLVERAPYFRDGIDAVVSNIRRTPPEALSPRAKTHNYINLLLADREVKAQNPGAWGILLDTNGNLCEGLGSNIFLVKDGVLHTPRERFVLPGVSRSVVLELAAKIGIAAEETDLDLFDAYSAEEAFMTSTSLCMCPIRSINGRALSCGSIPGPTTQALIDAWSEELGFDFVAQYLRRLQVAAGQTV